jgi:hypothetical protein
MLETATKTTHAPIVFIDLATLEAQVAEALEAANEASRAACRTTTDEGFSIVQWHAAELQAQAAQAHYENLWNELDQLKAQLLQENTCTCVDLPDGRSLVCDYCANQADLRELLY